MKTYHVRVAVRVLEIYAVEANGPETAADDWNFGTLIHTDDEALDSEVLSVKEVRP
jgi:hypothetical protein